MGGLWFAASSDGGLLLSSTWEECVWVYGVGAGGQAGEEVRVWLGRRESLKVRCGGGDDDDDYGEVDEGERLPWTWEQGSMGTWSGRSRRAGI